MGTPAEALILETQSPAETAELGRRLGAVVRAGTLLALVGDLGSGKTRFVKGLAAGLGLPAEGAVTSPTFVLMNLYPGNLRIAHFDLYRLEKPDLASLGFYDFRDDGVVVMEWADRVDERLLGDHLRIDFEVTGENSRRLMIRANGPASRALLGSSGLS